MKRLGSSKLTSKSQAYIPEAVIDALGLKKGDDYILFFKDGKAVIIKKGKIVEDNDE